MTIPFSKVACDGNELKYVKEVLESGWLTTASKAALFEEKFAAEVHAPYACAVNSCTAAMHLALEALGVGPGDKVLVPTLTFTATAEVVRYLGADPVFLDVEYGSCLVTPDIVEAALEQNTGVKALIVVHYGGQAARMGGDGSGGIIDVCRAHDVRVVEDAAHAFPARRDGLMVGSLGDATCFSFYANKTITSAEGGMLTTADEAIADRARVMRLHGINRDIWKRFTTDSASWEYDVVAPGFKYNMADVNAAIGLAQLERAHEFRAERQRCARFYLGELAALGCIDLPVVHVDSADHAWHLFHIVLKPSAPVNRNAFIRMMSQEGIGTSVHFKPLHRMTYYRERYKLDPSRFPGAERMWQGCVSLPIYPSLTEEELGCVCAAVKGILTTA